jgi:hypothetical protein
MLHFVVPTSVGNADQISKQAPAKASTTGSTTELPTCDLTCILRPNTMHQTPSTCDSALRFSHAARKKTRGSIPPGLEIRIRVNAN